MPAGAQQMAPLTPTALAAVRGAAIQPAILALDETQHASATLKGVGIGLVAGALVGVAVGAKVESSNKGGSPSVREKYKGFGYAVFIPAGAVFGALVGGLIGATRD